MHQAVHMLLVALLITLAPTINAKVVTVLHKHF